MSVFELAFMLGLMGGPAVITASVALLATNSRRFPKWIVVIDAVLIVVVVASTATFFPLESAGVSYADQDLPDPTALDAWRNAVVTVVAVGVVLLTAVMTWQMVRTRRRPTMVACEPS